MVMPSTPCLLSASFTGSSLNGLMMASIFFIYGPLSGVPGAWIVCGPALALVRSPRFRSEGGPAAASTRAGGAPVREGGRGSRDVPRARFRLGLPHRGNQGACHSGEGPCSRRILRIVAALLPKPPACAQEAGTVCAPARERARPLT